MQTATAHRLIRVGRGHRGALRVMCLRPQRFLRTWPEPARGAVAFSAPLREVSAPLREVSAPLCKVRAPLCKVRAPLREVSSLFQSHRLRGGCPRKFRACLSGCLPRGRDPCQYRIGGQAPAGRGLGATRPGSRVVLVLVLVLVLVIVLGIVIVLVRVLVLECALGIGIALVVVSLSGSRVLRRERERLRVR